MSFLSDLFETPQTRAKRKAARAATLQRQQAARELQVELQILIKYCAVAETRKRAAYSVGHLESTRQYADALAGPTELLERIERVGPELEEDLASRQRRAQSALDWDDLAKVELELREGFTKMKHQALDYTNALGILNARRIDADRPDIPETLAKNGAAKGYLTHDDIAAHFPGQVLTSQQTDAVISRLRELNIAVIEHMPAMATVGLLDELTEDPPVTMEQIGAARNADSSVSCRFSFVCDRRWQDLPADTEPSTRFCDGCYKTVHLCLTPDEATEAIKAKHCVALLFRHEREL